MLRRGILETADDFRVGRFRRIVFPGDPEIDQMDFNVGRKNNILGLDIFVNNRWRLKVEEG